ncbi:MAG: nitroreductase family protein [Bacillota bacterium]|jgi:nitroreductase
MTNLQAAQALLDVLQKRRSIRKFTPRKLTAAETEILTKAVLLAPTSRDLQPCEFFFVADEAKIKALAKVKSGGTAPLSTAPLAVVVTADPEKCDVWTEDASIAAYTLLLQAEALGLGATWVQIRKRNSTEGDAEINVKKLLALPENLRVLAVVCIGEKAEEKAPRADESLRREKIHPID